MSRPVVLVAYDPAWPARFDEEAARLRGVVGDVLVDIHHVGSTSAPGLIAKPVIDTIPVVSSLAAFDALRPRLEAAGYQWRGEYGIARRRLLLRNERGARTANVHVYAEGDREIRRHTLFRDALRADPALLAEYAALKRSLRDRFPEDVEAYADAKTPFVRRVLAAHGWNEDDEGR